MEGLPLPLDLVYAHVYCYLRLNDIRRGMRVHKSWFFALIADGAFAHIKRNILAELPRLAVVFERFPWAMERRVLSLKPSRAKRRRKQWIMPSGGTWYTLKHWISPMRHLAELRLVFKRKRNQDLHPLLFAELMRCALQYNGERRDDDIAHLFERTQCMYGYLAIARKNAIRTHLYNNNLAPIRRLFTLRPHGPAVYCDETSNQFIHYNPVPLSFIYEGYGRIEELLKE